MRVRFLAAASEEFSNAVTYYPSEVRFNPDHSRDASAPTSRELARPVEDE